MYIITDISGTHRTAWTRSGALAVLAKCVPEAIITHRFTGRVIAFRTLNRRLHLVY
jgi:hypothetical protein